MKQGKAKAVTVVTNPERIQKGAARPVVGLTGSKRHLEAGAVQPVYHVDADYVRRHGLEKGEAMPVVAVAAAGREVMDGPAMPVYLVSGTLGDEIAPVTQTYIEKILTIAPANLLALWPLNETSGLTADNLEGTADRDGTYSGCTLANRLAPDGVNYAPLFDGTSDWVDLNINSGVSSLKSTFTPDEFTIAGWAYDAEPDGTTKRHMFRLRSTTGVNLTWLAKDSVAYQMTFSRSANGNTKTVTYGSMPTGWFHWAVTCSVTASELKLYINGVQQGGTTAGPVAWTGGNLTGNNNALGCADIVGTEEYYGWLFCIGVWNTPLAQPVIAQLATV